MDYENVEIINVTNSFIIVKINNHLKVFDFNGIEIDRRSDEQLTRLFCHSDITNKFVSNFDRTTKVGDIAFIEKEYEGTDERTAYAVDTGVADLDYTVSFKMKGICLNY